MFNCIKKYLEKSVLFNRNFYQKFHIFDQSKIIQLLSKKKKCYNL